MICVPPRTALWSPRQLHTDRELSVTLELSIVGLLAITVGTICEILTAACLAPRECKAIVLKKVVLGRSAMMEQTAWWAAQRESCLPGA